MSPEFGLRPTQAQLIHQFTQGEREIPYPPEFFALEGTMSQQEMEMAYEDGMFDPDVYAVLRGDYEDVEAKVHPKEGRFRFLFPVAFGLTCSQVYTAAVEGLQGNMPEAAQSAGAALLFLGAAEHLDYLSGRYYSEMLRYMAKQHCPPIYSPAALEEMSEESFHAGVMVGANAQQAIASIFARDPRVTEQAMSQDDPYEALREYGGPAGLAMRVARIVLTAEKEEITTDQMATLRHARQLIDQTNFNPETLCENGMDIYERMNQILDRDDEAGPDDALL